MTRTQTTENPEDREQEPQFHLTLGDTRVTVLGTAHVSRASADKVAELIDSGEFDAVAIELCPSRHQALTDPDALARMDLLRTLREGKAMMVTASLALGAYQQRTAESLGIEPGAEMRVAIESAKRDELPLHLLDREVGVTLKRIYRRVPWWRRFGLIGGLLTSVVSRQELTEDDIERIKEGDVLESTFSQFADQERELYEPLIEERDRYMAARLRELADSGRHRHILAVVGAGHLKGMERALKEERTPPEQVVAELEEVPPPSRWPKLIPWLIVAIVVAGFVIGFLRNPGLGTRLVIDWVVINGGLAGIGALIAAAHPLSILTAVVAAPITSLNPTIGAGVITGVVEAWLRKPEVGDFARLRTDTTKLSGWWKNHVTRVLLVFLLTSFGSTLGTYLGGFLIYGRLAGH